MSAGWCVYARGASRSGYVLHVMLVVVVVVFMASWLEAHVFR